MAYSRHRNKLQRPRPGTKTGMIYDHFIANEGEPVDSRELSQQLGLSGNEINNYIERLNNGYDVFIVHQGKGYYILLTEDELV